MPRHKPQSRPHNRLALYHQPRQIKNLSITASSLDKLNANDAITTYENGFVNGLRRAFNQDVHLVVRRDDVW